MAIHSLRFLHFYILLLVDTIHSTGRRGRIIGSRPLFFTARLYLDRRPLSRGPVFPHVGILAGSASCLEPLVESVLLEVLLQDLIIEYVVLDDRLTKVFQWEAHTKLPVCATSPDQGRQLL